MYASYRERGGDKKSKFLSGDGRIRDHWVKDNRLTSWQELALSALELQVEMKKGYEGEQ